MNTPPTRQHVLYALDCAVAQWIKARHLTEIHGLGQKKRYKRAIAHLEQVQGDLNVALFLLRQLIAIQHEDARNDAYFVE